MEKMARAFSSKITKNNWLRNVRYKDLIIGIILGAILLFASYLRLYKISEYMTFLGDEGRDVLIVKEILFGFSQLLHGDLKSASEHLTLLGPRASAGDFFTGPIYYYFMAPFLWLFHLDPVGPAVMIALLGIATVFLVYYAGAKFFSTFAGLTAAFLYAIAPLVIGYSRSSWNPNPLPFFSLLIIYLLYKAVKKPSGKLFVIIGILFGIVLQLHYISTFLGVIIVAFLITAEWVERKKIRVLDVSKKGFHLLIGFLVGYSLFLAFELRHGFPNIRTIIQFILTNSGGEKEAQSFIEIVPDIFFRLFARLVTKFPPPEQIAVSVSPYFRFWQIATVLLAIAAVFALFKIKDKMLRLLLVLWFFLGIFLFGFYKKPIYDYYFEFMFPLPFLIVGNLLSILFYEKHYKNIGKILCIGILIFLTYINALGFPFRSPPNKQKDQVKHIAEFVLSKTENKPFNFALITLGNSDHGYRYFFEIHNRKPVAIENEEKDPERKTVTDQLLIVCEDTSCKPLGHPLWEVAGFGRAEIADEWDISVVKVFRLVHLKEK